jgi:hypothetical protein
MDRTGSTAIRSEHAAQYPLAKLAKSTKPRAMSRGFVDDFCYWHKATMLAACRYGRFVPGSDIALFRKRFRRQTKQTNLAKI